MSYSNQIDQIELEITNFTPPISASPLHIEELIPTKRLKSPVNYLRLLFDLALIYGAFVFSYYLRFNWFNFDNAQLQVEELNHYLSLGGIYSLITISLLALSRIFLVSYKTNFAKIAFLTAGLVLTSILGMTLLQFLEQPTIFFSRLAFIFLAPVTWLALTAECSTLILINRLAHLRKVEQAAFTSNISSLSGESVLPVEKTTSRFTLFSKRSVDLIGATVFLLIFAIPLVFIALVVKLDSKGPVIFKQTRVGKNGKYFTFYKFRSMYTDADQRIAQLLEFNETKGATFKMKNDPRVTRVGRFLRRTSIDEIPQLLNIILGQMSLVGPRPGLPREIMRYQPWQYRRLEVTPGLTGLWQVSGRSSIGFEEMIKLDIYYVEHYSFMLDVKILFKTVAAVLSGKGAY